nr:hypothetical protein CFP56_78111 [Quercus suber]
MALLWPTQWQYVGAIAGMTRSLFPRYVLSSKRWWGPLVVLCRSKRGSLGYVVSVRLQPGRWCGTASPGHAHVFRCLFDGWSLLATCPVSSLPSRAYE